MQEAKRRGEKNLKSLKRYCPFVVANSALWQCRACHPDCDWSADCWMALTEKESSNFHNAVLSPHYKEKHAAEEESVQCHLNSSTSHSMSEEHEGGLREVAVVSLFASSSCLFSRNT